MSRVLDLDLDFFVHGALHFVDLNDLTRPDSADLAAWTVDEAMSFLRDQCGLDAPLPGWAIERHGEAFERWHEARQAGSICSPMSVVHVDAHADLGLGEPVHLEIMGDLLFEPVDIRAEKATRVTDGSYLAYACAAGWIGDLTYVHNDAGGKDLHPFHMRDWDPDADALQLKAVNRADLSGITGISPTERPVARLDPEIPFRRLGWRDYRSDGPFDAIVICRSPNFTPATADPIYDMICDRFLRPS